MTRFRRIAGGSFVRLTRGSVICPVNHEADSVEHEHLLGACEITTDMALVQALIAMLDAQASEMFVQQLPEILCSSRRSVVAKVQAQ